jgi:hypothetical protein
MAAGQSRCEWRPSSQAPTARFHNGSVEIRDDPKLEVDLIGPEYGFSIKNQIQLEQKEDMKRRGLASPDLGDFLAMTFAVRSGY